MLFFFLAAPRREIPMFVWLSIFGALTSSYGSYYTYRGRFRIIVARVLTFSYVQPCFASSVGERNIIKVENNFYAHSSFRKFFISKGAEFSKKKDATIYSDSRRLTFLKETGFVLQKNFEQLLESCTTVCPIEWSSCRYLYLMTWCSTKEQLCVFVQWKFVQEKLKWA